PTSLTKFIAVHLPRTCRDIWWLRYQVRSLAATVCTPFGDALEPKFMHKLYGLIVRSVLDTPPLLVPSPQPAAPSTPLTLCIPVLLPGRRGYIRWLRR